VIKQKKGGKLTDHSHHKTQTPPPNVNREEVSWGGRGKRIWGKEGNTPKDVLGACSQRHGSRDAWGPNP